MSMLVLMDTYLGRLMEKLEAKKMRENTVILFTSDFGVMQGAHRLRLKGGNSQFLIRSFTTCHLTFSSRVRNRNARLSWVMFRQRLNRVRYWVQPEFRFRRNAKAARYFFYRNAPNRRMNMSFSSIILPTRVASDGRSANTGVVVRILPRG